VVVSRPSRWGNPFRVGVDGGQVECVAWYRDRLLAGDLLVRVDGVRRNLAGRDLACWCRLEDPCHADVLLEVANQPGPGQTGLVDNAELRRRYEAGEPLADLAEAAAMSRSAIQVRLRRNGVPPRRRQPDSGHELGRDEIQGALANHRSVAAAAKAVGVGRIVFTARAQRLGILPGPDIPSDLAERYQAGASVRDLAEGYGVGKSTITRWLDAAGVARRGPGRQPRDG
jgi:hypothetical protein